jgi:hypothetical protein
MSDETVHFQVTYDGLALDAHEMDINDLAPSLLALSDLIKQANKVLNSQTNASVAVKIKGSFQAGSFGLEVGVHQSALDFFNLFNQPLVTGALNLLTLLGFVGVGGKGLLEVLKWLKNRPIQHVEKIDDKTIVLHVKDDSLPISHPVLQLLVNMEIRKSVEKLLAPLRVQGISTFYTQFKQTQAITIDHSELAYFEAPLLPEEVIEDFESVTTLQIVNVAFQESGKWRFTDGAGSFYAVVKDGLFIERVQNSTENFAKDDLLKVRLRRIQYETETGIKTDHEILEVLEHRRIGQQLKLPLDDA